MSLQDSYKMVISAEIHAQKLYEALGRSFGKPETKAVFTELMMLEKTHETKVREIYTKLFPQEELKLQAVEAIELQGLDLSDPKAVLEFAVQREELAEKFYRKIAERTNNPDIRQMLLQYANEEENHKTVLLTEIQRLQGAMEWFDASELSGLMEY